MFASNTACSVSEYVKKFICRPGYSSQGRTAQSVLRRASAMHVWLALYGAARVVIGQPHVDIAFDSPSITLGEVLEKLIALYPRAQPYLLDEAGMLPPYMRVLINEVRLDPDATPATLLHDQDRVTLLVAVAGGKR